MPALLLRSKLCVLKTPPGHDVSAVAGTAWCEVDSSFAPKPAFPMAQPCSCTLSGNVMAGSEPGSRVLPSIPGREHGTPHSGGEEDQFAASATHPSMCGNFRMTT